MQLFADQKEEYKKRHDAIWPELVSLLKETGISDYSIFLDETTNSLFGVLRAKDALLLDNLRFCPCNSLLLLSATSCLSNNMY